MISQSMFTGCGSSTTFPEESGSQVEVSKVKLDDKLKLQGYVDDKGNSLDKTVVEKRLAEKGISAQQVLHDLDDCEGVSTISAYALYWKAYGNLYYRCFQPEAKFDDLWYFSGKVVDPNGNTAFQFSYEGLYTSQLRVVSGHVNKVNGTYVTFGRIDATLRYRIDQSTYAVVDAWAEDNGTMHSVTW